jgi:hypothetical protein
MQWQFITWQKIKIKIPIANDLENNYSEYDNIDYWIEDLQLIKIDDNILLDSNIWLSDRHLTCVMQILYVEGYEQHTYAIIKKKYNYKKMPQYIFINNNHWVLVKIQMLITNLHCIIFDSHMPMTTKLLNNIIKLLCKFINVNNLSYTYANVM